MPGIDAVVILGAGMDTRPYRLARRSDVPVFEVDLPVNIERKAAVVRRVLGEAPPSVRLVPVDFERDDLAGELAKAGHRGDDRTFFIWEGVTQYLTADAVARHLRAPAARAARQPVGVHLCATGTSSTARTCTAPRSAYRRFREKQQLWRFGLDPDEMSAFVAEYGWRLIEQAGPDYFLRHYVEPAGPQADRVAAGVDGLRREGI